MIFNKKLMVGQIWSGTYYYGDPKKSETRAFEILLIIERVSLIKVKMLDNEDIRYYNLNSLEVWEMTFISEPVFKPEFKKIKVIE